MGPALKTRQSHTIKYGDSMIVPEGHSRGEQKSCGTARFCSDAAYKYTDVRPGHRMQPSLAHTVQVEHQQVDASGYT